jgi:methylenetetrahydrofolate dehydrogenase (NADP+)/methenyltetrahydrofolate cyclohydrolase
VLDELAVDPDVTGILLQLPLPPHVDAAALLARIPAEKDVDGLTEANAARLVLGRPGLRPCTPSGVMALLDAEGVGLQGVDAVVVGRSDLVGRPMAQMLLQRDATSPSAIRGPETSRARAAVPTSWWSQRGYRCCSALVP